MSLREKLLWLGLLALVLAMFGGLVALMVADDNQWQAYKAAHACKVVAHVTGDVFSTVAPTSNGGIAVGVGTTSGKTGWLCDDGITYFR
jgi:hypothetical protein